MKESYQNIINIDIIKITFNLSQVTSCHINVNFTVVFFVLHLTFLRFCVTELRLFFQLRGLQCTTLAYRFPQGLQLREQVLAVIHSKCLRVDDG